VLPLAALVQARLAAADTVVVLAAPSGWRLWVETLADIATIIIAIAIILFALALIGAVLAARRGWKAAESALGKLRVDTAPILEQANAIAGEVRQIAGTARGEAERLGGLVAETSEKVSRITSDAEQRVHDFTALLKVMQEEAEDLFIGTAATLRGVRVGTRALRSDEPLAEWDEEEDEGEWEDDAHDEDEWHEPGDDDGWDDEDEWDDEPDDDR
jgi:uncharacterized protein YoxC